MESNFLSSLELVLKHEGGYVNNPNDPGGATNKGITIGTYRRYVDRRGTIRDLKAITDEQVALIYKRHYWDAVRGDLLPRGIDYAVFDFAVNSGPNRAVKCLQRVVAATQDGIVGPVTLAKTRGSDRKKTINQLCDDRLSFMKRIKGGKSWKHFGRGWSRRVADVRKHALAMDVSSAPPPKADKLPVPQRKSGLALIFDFIASFFKRK